MATGVGGQTNRAATKAAFGKLKRWNLDSGPCVCYAYRRGWKGVTASPRATMRRYPR